MTFAQLNDWALRAKRVMSDEYTISWGLTMEETLEFSIEDLNYLHNEYGLNMVKDNRGCLAFTK